MREILFRGKGKKSGEWLFGDFLAAGSDGVPWILPKQYMEEVKVDPATVGQFTGLTDKNGKKIFEGDICRIGNLLYKVEFKCSCWWFTILSSKVYCCPAFNSHCGDYCEVIGNIHDNDLGELYGN